MRQDWTTEQLPIPFVQNLIDYTTDTTNGFKISNPSASTSIMSRLVNIIPNKHGDNFTFKKRPGCVSSVSINSVLPTPRDAFLSSSGFVYAGGNSGSYCQALAYNGTTVYTLGPTTGFGISGHAAMGFGEVDLGTSGKMVLFVSQPTSTAPTYVPADLATTSEGYYVDESDLETATYGPVTGTCAVTNNSATVSSIASTAKFVIGQVISFTYSATTQWRTILTIPDGVSITVNAVLTLGTVTATFDKGYVYKITDTDYPGNAGVSVVGGMASLNGYQVVMTKNGDIYNSDVNSVTAWAAASITNAQQAPDTGRGVLQYRNYILAFCAGSIEFFSAVASVSDSSFQVAPELFIRLGVRSPKHYSLFENTLAFMGNGTEGGNSIYLMEDYRPKRISTEDIDYIVSKLGPTNYEVKVMTLYGKHLVLLNPLSSLASDKYTTFVYSVEDEIWFEWKVTEGGTSTDYTQPWQFPGGAINDVVYCVSPAQATNGPYITKFNPETDTNYYDNLSASSKAVTVFIQTPIINLKTNKYKFMSKLHLTHKSDSSYNPGANVTVYWSDDSGQTWKSRAFSSTKGILTGFGQFRKRIMRVVEATTNFYEITLLEIEFKRGTH